MWGCLGYHQVWILLADAIRDPHQLYGLRLRRINEISCIGSIAARELMIYV